MGETLILHKEARGKIPVLQIDDRFLPESNAACHWLAARDAPCREFWGMAGNGGETGRKKETILVGKLSGLGPATPEICN